MQLPANKVNKSISVSHLISAEDDGDSLQSYTLQSSKGQGSFQFKGKTYSNKALTVGADDLARVTYLPPASGGVIGSESPHLMVKTRGARRS